MPGVFGFVGVIEPDGGEKLLHKLSAGMTDLDWYQVGLYTGEGYGLGWSGPGYLNAGQQPIWNEDKTLCIVMEGEIYDCQSMKHDLVEKGYRFEIGDDAEFILHLFEEYGRDFAQRLNGAFVAAIWNNQTRELTLLNDRLGLRPLYYAFYNGRFTFASGVRALLRDSSLPRTIDPVGIAQILAFEHMLDTRTYLRDVHLLPPASTLTLRDKTYSIEQYWKPEFSGTYKLRTKEECLDDLMHFLHQAIKRQLPVDLPAGINLSGGLDSRMLLGLLCSSGAKEILTSFTFGIPNCDDARFAKELSSRMKVPHQFLELKPDYLLDVSKKGVMLTDGFMSCYHLHALANAEYQAQKVQVVYGGYYIDSLISSDLRRDWVVNYDDDTSCQLIYDSSNYVFKGETGQGLFTDEFRNRFNTEFNEVFRAAVMEAKAPSFLDWFNQFDLRHRARRFDENGNELLRGDLICRTPFCDKDLVEFALTLPPGFRLDRIIFIEAIARLFPKLAKVPWDKTGFPLMPCGRDLILRLDQQLRWQLRKYGLNVSDRVYRPYADYNTWMRTILRNWVEETLLSKQALERGYFNPSSMRNLVMSHMNGENHARELGMLLSMELWHKQYLD